MSLQLDSLIKSINILERSVKTANRVDNSDEDLLKTVRAGVIQHFKVAYELSWKMLKRWLKENMGAAAVDGVIQRNLFRLGAENRLIVDVERWIEYHDARNSTSHTYDEDAAYNVYLFATEFVHDANHLLKMLEARNDRS